MNPAYLSAFSALAGSAIGAMASFSTTWLTQHFQDRTQRRAQESTRQERIYGDFIDEASKLFADALLNSMESPAKIVPLYAIFGKLRLFSSVRTTEAADKVLKRIIRTYYAPRRDFQDVENLDANQMDLLQEFIMSCREDLRG